MRNQPLVPTLLIVVVMTVILFGLGGMLIYENVASDPTSPGLPAAPLPPSELSEFEAQRAQTVSETQAPPVPTFADTESGVVTESTGEVIRLAGRDAERVWPVTADVEIWKHGEKISAADIQAGDTVRLRIRNLGSRRDGWIPTVTRINVDPPPEETSASQPAATVSADAGPESDAAGLRDVSYAGEVTDVDDRTITIVDSLDDTLTFAVATAATVHRGNGIGPLADLAKGDQVKLVGQRVGDRSDGQTILIERIEVQ